MVATVAREESIVRNPIGKESHLGPARPAAEILAKRVWRDIDAGRAR
jgi:hypothetical protein